MRFIAVPVLVFAALLLADSVTIGSAETSDENPFSTGGGC
jgi:hypothetical protein